MLAHGSRSRSRRTGGRSQARALLLAAEHDRHRRHHRGRPLPRKRGDHRPRGSRRGPYLSHRRDSRDRDGVRARGDGLGPPGCRRFRRLLRSLRRPVGRLRDEAHLLVRRDARHRRAVDGRGCVLRILVSGSPELPVHGGGGGHRHLGERPSRGEVRLSGICVLDDQSRGDPRLHRRGRGARLRSRLAGGDRHVEPHGGGRPFPERRSRSLARAHSRDHELPRIGVGRGDRGRGGAARENRPPRLLLEPRRRSSCSTFFRCRSS